MNCFCLLFRPETRFLKSFTANILSQFQALHFTRSDRGQGGAHYHHIQPVKSPQTDFTQILPLVKWEFHAIQYNMRKHTIVRRKPFFLLQHEMHIREGSKNLSTESVRKVSLGEKNP